MNPTATLRRRLGGILAGTAGLAIIVTGTVLVGAAVERLDAAEEQLGRRSAVVQYLADYSRWDGCLVELDGQFGDARAAVDVAVAHLDALLARGLAAAANDDDEVLDAVVIELLGANAELDAALAELDRQRARRVGVEEPPPDGCGPIPLPDDVE